MATNLQKEAQELFGNPATASGLVTFDPQSYSRAVGLPGTEDIAGPNPLAAIATAGTRTYTPSISRGFEQEIKSGQPAFLSDINIAAPDVDDLGTINDVPGFENVSIEAIKSLGLVGMTPTSLTRTFNNLTSLDATNIANNAFNIATNNTPIAGVLGIADKALSGAFNRGLSLANPMQAAQLAILASNLANIDINKLGDIPGQIGQNIEGLIKGMADFVDAPLETLEAFVEMAGTYAHYGTFSPNLNSFNVNGIEQAYVTNQKGEVVTTPGFVKATMGMAPISTLAQAANIVASLLGGETAQEKAGREMANMQIAARMPSFSTVVDVPQLAGQVNMSITSVPDMFSTRGHLGLDFTDIVSIAAKDIPGLDYDININLAEYSRTGHISGAVIGNAYDPIGFEDEQIAEDIGAALAALASSPNEEQNASRSYVDAVAAVGMAEYQSQMDVNVDEAEATSMAGEAEAISAIQSLGLAAIAEAVNTGQITNAQTFADFVAEVDPNLALSEINSELGYGVALQAAYQANVAKGTPFGVMAQSLHPHDPVTANKITDPYAIQLQYTYTGQNLGNSYNSQNPSMASISLANAVMGVTNTNTYQPNFNALDATVAANILGVMSRHNATAEEAVGMMSMEGAQGGFSEGFGDMGAAQAQAAYNNDPLSDFDMSVAGFYDGDNIGDAEAAADAGRDDVTGLEASRDEEAPGNYTGAFDGTAGPAGAPGAPAGTVDAPNTGFDPGYGGGGGDSDGGGEGGTTYICTAAYSNGVSNYSTFSANRKYGIGLRRTDPYLMRGYDLVGPRLAKIFGKTKVGKVLTSYYKMDLNGDRLSIGYKVLQVFLKGFMRPLVRTIGYVDECVSG